MQRQAPALLVALSLAASACTTSSPAPARAPAEFHADPAGGGLPFSESVRAGDLLFLSGEIGRRPGTTELVPGGIGPEARQTMENIKAKLARRGLTMDDVVKCTVFLADIKEWPAFNEVYRTYFPKHFPARSALAASGLVAGARAEVECIAYVPPAVAPR